MRKPRRGQQTRGGYNPCMTLPASFTSALLCAALTAACSQSGTPRVFNSNEPELGGTSLSMVQPKTMDCREPSRPEAERPTDSALGIWPAPSRLEFSSQSPDQVLFDALRHYDVKFREIRVCVSGNNARVMIVAMDDGTESLAWMHVASWGWSVDEVRPDNLSITYQRERGTSQPLELTTSRLVGEAVSISDDGGPLRSVGPWNVTTGGVSVTLPPVPSTPTTWRVLVIGSATTPNTVTRVPNV